MKLKRSQRLVDFTHYLLTHPHQLITLSFFSGRYQVAKSSISEDVSILRNQFQLSGIGEIVTTAGAGGGVTYIPRVSREDAVQLVEELCRVLDDDSRMLPGGYFYMTDILADPSYLPAIGKLIASVYRSSQATVVMTVATRGIALAEMAAHFLNVPFVTVQRDTKQAEGSSVSVNYVSGADSQVDKMSITKDDLQDNERVLIVDDFLNVGGTMNGMLSVVREFNSQCVGAVVMAEVASSQKVLDFPYRSVVKIEKSADGKKIEAIRPGNLLRDY